MYKRMFFICSVALSGTLVGCSGADAAKQSDKDLRTSFEKPKVDINDVPASQKAMVQGFIDRANAMRAKAAAGGKPGSPGAAGH